MWQDEVEPLEYWAACRGKIARLREEAPAYGFFALKNVRVCLFISSDSPADDRPISSNLLAIYAICYATADELRQALHGGLANALVREVFMPSTLPFGFARRLGREL